MKCKECGYKKHYARNGRPGRWYCENPEAKGLANSLICSSGRHDKELQVKTAPRWCPLNKKEKNND